MSLVLLVFATGVVATGVLVARRSQYPSTWDARVADLVSFVEKERGRAFQHPVEVEFLAEDEFRQTVTKPTESASDDDRAELERTVQSLRALGLLQGDVDLAGATNQLRQEGTLAFYDPKTKRVKVRGTNLDVSHKVTLVHEMTHALQDQYFDLNRLQKFPTAEEAEAFRTVVEGDAVRIENKYVAQLPAADRDAYRAQARTDSEQARQGVKSVPDVLVASFSAPYAFGTPFLEMLESKAGTDEVDQGLRRPPPNVGQIVDPTDYFADKTVTDVPEPEVPAGATKVDTPDKRKDTLGPLLLYMMLSARLDPHKALAVLDRWNGDALVTYRAGDRLCVRAAMAPDAGATADVKATLDQWQQAMPPEASAQVTSKGDLIELTTCDPGPGADAKIQGKPSDALSLPAVRLYVLSAAFEGKVPQPRAVCIANAFVDKLSVEAASTETTDPADARRRLEDAKAVCPP